MVPGAVYRREPIPPIFLSCGIPGGKAREGGAGTRDEDETINDDSEAQSPAAHALEECEAIALRA